MLFQCRPLFAPPKLSRNNYFPWPNFILHQSGTWLAPNRVCFRVPVHLTKLEIREYLRKIYGVKAIKVNTMIKLPKVEKDEKGKYFKTGVSYKKAYITCEEVIPNEVKMLQSSKDLRKNPDLTPGFFVNSKITPFRPNANRRNDWKPRHDEAWKEPLPLLLRGKGAAPRISKDEENSLHVDKRYPFQHFTKRREIPRGTPEQSFPRINVEELRNARNPPKLVEAKNDFIRE